jgi:hypothetical protein
MPEAKLPTPLQRAALIARCWTAHDAGWFAIAEASLGTETANRFSRSAAQAQGRFEAREAMRLFALQPVAALDDYLTAQELLLGMLAPGVLRHEIEVVDDETCRLRVTRCLAHEQAVQAGAADRRACAVVARIAGWLQGLGARYALNPCASDGCPLGRGETCAFTITVSSRSTRSAA